MSNTIISIHIDTVWKICLTLVALFFAWNWRVAENEVRNQIESTASASSGWARCQLNVAPRLDTLEQAYRSAIGLQKPAAEAITP